MKRSPTNKGEVIFTKSNIFCNRIKKSHFFHFAYYILWSSLASNVFYLAIYSIFAMKFCLKLPPEILKLPSSKINAVTPDFFAVYWISTWWLLFKTRAQKKPLCSPWRFNLSTNMDSYWIVKGVFLSSAKKSITKVCIRFTCVDASLFSWLLSSRIFLLFDFPGQKYTFAFRAIK